MCGSWLLGWGEGILALAGGVFCRLVLPMGGRWGFGILSHFCERGGDLLVVRVGRRVLVEAALVQQ